MNKRGIVSLTLLLFAVCGCIEVACAETNEVAVAPSGGQKDAPPNSIEDQDFLIAFDHAHGDIQTVNWKGVIGQNLISTQGRTKSARGLVALRIAASPNAVTPSFDEITTGGTTVVDWTSGYEAFSIQYMNPAYGSKRVTLAWSDQGLLIDVYLNLNAAFLAKYVSMGTAFIALANDVVGRDESGELRGSYTYPATYHDIMVLPGGQWLYAATSDGRAAWGFGAGSYGSAYMYAGNDAAAEGPYIDVVGNGHVRFCLCAESNIRQNFQTALDAFIISPVRSGQILAGDSLRFAGQTSIPTDVRWDLGDGRSSSLEAPGLVSFPNPGLYAITLHTLDSSGHQSAFYDFRNISVQPGITTAPDLEVGNLTIPPGLTVGQPATLTYTVKNVGDASLSTTSWQDAIYLSQDPYLDSADRLLGYVSVNKNLDVGGEYSNSITVTVPPVTEGVYYLLLSANNNWSFLEHHRLNNEFAVSANVMVPVLENGVGQTIPVAPGRVAEYFRVDVPDGQNLLVSLDSTVHGLQLYARFGAIPTRGTYDDYSNGSTLLVPAATTGTWYILVYDDAVTQTGQFTALSRLGTLQVLSITPTRQAANAPLTLTIHGAGFTGSPQVQLIGIGKTSHPADNVEVNSFTKLTATWSGGVPPGHYDVSVSIGGVSGALPSAFEAYSGKAGQIKTNLVLPSSVGYHGLATIYVEYQNVGDTAIQAPLLILTATQNNNAGAFLTLEETHLISGFWTSAIPEGFSHSVQFLASGAVPGVLEPGESGRVPVYYAGWQQPWDMSYPPIYWDLGVLDSSDSDSIDWSSLKDSMRPSYIRADAWDAVWANFTSQVGSTWGQYAATLASNANYLGQLGYSVADVNQLLALQFRKADGLNPLAYLGTATDAYVQAPGIPIVFWRAFAQPISRRYTLGPLGRGWRHNWEFSVTKSNDGTVTITDMTGTPRIFQPDSRNQGQYLAQPGDHAKLNNGKDGRVVLQEPDGFQSSFMSNGNLEFIQDTNGNRITCGYDEGLLTSLTHSSGQSLTISYTGNEIQNLADSSGRQTILTYIDEHLTSAKTYDGLITTYAYHTGEGTANEHALKRTTFPDGTRVYFEYDNNGRLAWVTTDGPVCANFNYDTTAKVSATDALQNKAAFYFDNWGQVVKVEDPFGNAVFFTFDQLRNLTAVTDSAGRSNRLDYDNCGHIVRWTDANGAATSFSYGTAYDRLAKLTDANKNQTQYGYFPGTGNLKSITYADGSVESWTYDSTGNPTAWINRRGNTVQYQYDYSAIVGGQLASKTFVSDPQVTYAYDARGNLTQTVDTRGTTTYHYNTNDYLSQIDYPGGQSLMFTYDAAGRRASSQDQPGHRLDYHYDDPLGNLTSLTDENVAVVVAYEYDAAGRLAQKTLGNGVFTTYGYDAAGQLLHLINSLQNGTVLSHFDYTYDSRGRRMAMDTNYGTWTYTYDDMGQLTHAGLISSNPAIPNQDFTYAYDALGNRISTVVNGVSENYAVNNLNQYTQVGSARYRFDADGNLVQGVLSSGTTAYTYSDENRLVRVTKGGNSWTYAYDALGSRISTTKDGTTTNYIVDPIEFGNVVGEYDGANNLLARNDYAFGLIDRKDSSNNAVQFTFDAIGSTSENTDKNNTLLNRYVYEPFGTVLWASETTSHSFGYVGELDVMDDGNGLDFMGARYYNPALGCFVSVDPLGLLGGDINLSRYCENNPLSLTDPSGLCHNYKAEHQAWMNNRYGGPKRNRTDPYLRDQEHRTYAAMKVQSGMPSWVMKLGVWTRSRFKENGWNNMPVLGWFSESVLHLGPDGNPEYPNTPATPGEEAAGYLGADEGEIERHCAESTKPIIPPTPTHPKHPSPAPNPTPVTPSWDPNAKTGPAGYGDKHYVLSNSLLPYRVTFENDPTAAAPAQVVQITDTLNLDLDLTTLELTGIGFGDTLITVPRGLQYFETTQTMTYANVSFQVQVQAGLRTGTGEVFANFYSIDPGTQLPPPVNVGFLPPEDGTGRGQGYVTYVIRPKNGLSTGTEIRNVASVQFDFGETISTNQVNAHDPSQGTNPNKEALVTIDAGAPSSSVMPLPATTTALSFTVSWSGNDDAKGSGVASYDIYAQDNDGNWQVWLQKTAQTSATFTGDDGHTYSFYSVATDNAGNSEHATALAQASTHIAIPQYALVIHTTGQGTVSPPGGVYVSGTSVTLTPSPATGWHFDHWDGSLTGNANPAVVAMDSDKTVTALFLPTQCTLRVDVTGQGTVALNPTGATYNAGTNVTLKPNPASGWYFQKWTGDLTGAANPASIVVDSDKAVTAVFDKRGGCFGGTIAEEDSSRPVTPQNGGDIAILMITAGLLTFPRFRGTNVRHRS